MDTAGQRETFSGSWRRVEQQQTRVDMGGVVGVTLALLTLRAVSAETRGECEEGRCLVLHRTRVTFSEAQHTCVAARGRLLRLRSLGDALALRRLLEGVAGHVWVGLRRAGGRCPDAGGGLRGYEWSGGDNSSAYTNWMAPPVADALCPPRCVSVSPPLLEWTERSCAGQTDGLVCECQYPERCAPLGPRPGPHLYYTPCGFSSHALRELPEGTVATAQPERTRHLCSASSWVHAPWNCEVLGGGCEDRCEKAGPVSSCVCSPGHALDANGVTCSPQQAGGDLDTPACPPGWVREEGVCVDEDECVSAPCDHACANTAGSFRCWCLPGFTLSSALTCEPHCALQRCPAACEGNTGVCECPRGFVLEDDAVCVDIDECDSGQCEQSCSNSYGSFQCACEAGFHLRGGVFCMMDTPEGVVGVSGVRVWLALVSAALLALLGLVGVALRLRSRRRRYDLATPEESHTHLCLQNRYVTRDV